MHVRIGNGKIDSYWSNNQHSWKKKNPWHVVQLLNDLILTSYTSEKHKMTKLTLHVWVISYGNVSNTFVWHKQLTYKFTSPLPQVVGYAHSYYELRAMRPKLHKLHRLLEDEEYEGEYKDKMSDDDGLRHRRYTLEDLKGLVQASEAELMSELRIIRACCVNGKLF